MTDVTDTKADTQHEYVGHIIYVLCATETYFQNLVKEARSKRLEQLPISGTFKGIFFIHTTKDLSLHGAAAEYVGSNQLTKAKDYEKEVTL